MSAIPPRSPSVSRNLDSGSTECPDISIIQTRIKVHYTALRTCTRTHVDLSQSLLTAPVDVSVTGSRTLAEPHPQDGPVLWQDGQPAPLRLTSDAFRQPADALRRPLLPLVPQPAVLLLQIPLQGPTPTGES